MSEKRQMRIVKRNPERCAGQAVARPASAAREGRPERVISGWVREHRNRAEELRQNYAALLAEVGFGLPGQSAK